MDKNMSEVTSDVTNEVTRERIQRLERDCRCLIAIAVVALVGTLVLVVDASDLFRRRGTVEAEAFLLRNSAGAVRARLGFQSNGSPEVALMDSQGRSLLSLETQADDSASVTLSSKGEPRTTLMSHADGTSYLKFVNRDGEESLSLYVSFDKETGLVLNRKGRAVHMILKRDDSPKLWVTDPRADTSEVSSRRDSGPVRMAP
jgi:hypothetical protein